MSMNLAIQHDISQLIGWQILLPFLVLHGTATLSLILLVASCFMGGRRARTWHWSCIPWRGTCACGRTDGGRLKRVFNDVISWLEDRLGRTATQN